MEEKKDKLKIVQQLLASAKNSLQSADQIIKKITGTSNASSAAKEKANDLSSFDGGKIIEGVFDGINMVGPDQKEYKVPENYASKSKLIEGDVLKLTIGEDGGFIFKQIKPAPRKRITGTLVEEAGNFRAVADGKSYKILTAAVTYNKARDNDPVTIAIPEDGNASWAAFENVADHSTGGVADAEEKTDAVPAENSVDVSEVPAVETKSDILFPEQGVLPDADTDMTEQSASEVPTDTAAPVASEQPVEEAKQEEPSEGVKELEI